MASLGLLEDDHIFIAGVTHAVIEADGVFIVAGILYGAGVRGGVLFRQSCKTALAYENLALGYAGLVGFVPQAGADNGGGISHDG